MGSNKDNFDITEDLDTDCKNSSCNICSFCKDFIAINKKIIYNYLCNKEFIKTSYYNHYLKFENSDYLEKKNINFSWNIDRTEGPARIRNKLKAKIDLIDNNELHKSFYENKEFLEMDEISRKCSTLSKEFDYFDVNSFLNKIYYLDQILHLNSISQMGEDYDVIKYSFNCLLIRDYIHKDCVMAIGTKKVYIFVNSHIDINNNFISAKYKFNNSFWVINEYDEIWKETCPYLNNYNDKVRDDSPKIRRSFSRMDSTKIKRINDEFKKKKFTRERDNFKIISFDIKNINEIHKKRFLLKQNALEIFLDSGDNFLFAFNIDKRDKIFEQVIILFIELN